MKSSTSVVSQAASIAQSTASQVEVKMRTNQTKAQLRVLLKNIDLDKSGVVKEEAFFTILKLHGVELSDAEKNRLKKDYARAGKINFADALHSINIDLESAVLNEEKWTVQKQSQAKSQEAQNSLLPGKAVSHLSRLSLAEFNERQNEMQMEIDGNAANAAPTRNQDQVSKAGSSVSKNVRETNLEQLQDFRSKIGLIQKNRPEKDQTSNVMDGVTVRTPNPDMEDLDRLSVKLSTVGIRDANGGKAPSTTASQAGGATAGGMTKFMQQLAKQDKAQYERLVELMRFFNLIDIDMRQVSQLKASFISKEQGVLQQVPLAAFKDTMKGVFKHFRQLDEIVAKIAECVEVEIAKDGVKQKLADSAKLSQLIEFMKCFPLLVRRDKNSSSGMNYVMATSSDQQSRTASPTGQLKASPAASLSQQELVYVKQLASLVMTRMEEKHRNITDVFRFMDQRGKGKVRKSDFVSAVERMRISLSREDTTKVWNYFDAAQQGYIQLAELSVAYANRVSNFNKTAETAVENKASLQYRLQSNSEEQKSDSRNVGSTTPAKSSPKLGTQRTAGPMQMPTGLRSPLKHQAIEHVYGAKNLPSDEIGKVVQNQWMLEAALATKVKNEEIAKAKAALPKGLKSKQTVTSLLRREANKQILTELVRSSPGQSSSGKMGQIRRGLSQNLTKGSTKQLPPLQKAPGSRRGFSRGLQIHDESKSKETLSVTYKNLSRAGSYATDRVPKNPLHERVLFPTQVKESFLQRNKHMANAKMEQMAAEFAKRAMV